MTTGRINQVTTLEGARAHRGSVPTHGQYYPTPSCSGLVHQKKEGGGWAVTPHPHPLHCCTTPPAERVNLRTRHSHYSRYRTTAVRLNARTSVPSPPTTHPGLPGYMGEPRHSGRLKWAQGTPALFMCAPHCSSCALRPPLTPYSRQWHATQPPLTGKPGTPPTPLTTDAPDERCNQAPPHLALRPRGMSPFAQRPPCAPKR